MNINFKTFEYYKVNEHGAFSYCSEASEKCHKEDDDSDGNQEQSWAEIVIFHEYFEVIVYCTDRAAYGNQ